MSNNSVNSSFMGPSYPYYKYIRTPKQLGMSSKGNNIGNNIGGLISYIELLVTGETRASATGGPLGDKFFLKTIAKCHDIKTNNTVNRSIYINNIPDGNIPFISSGLGGVSFSSFKGLIPGVMGNIGNLNPLNLLIDEFTNLILLKVLLILEFVIAIFSALVEISIPIPLDLFNSCNNEIIIHPEPVPTSKINGLRPSKYLANFSTKISVSGLGIKTPLSILSFMLQNSLLFKR